MKSKKTLKLLTAAAALTAAVVMLASCSAKMNGEASEDMMVDFDVDKEELYTNGTNLPSYSEKGEMADGSLGDSADDSGTGSVTGEFEPKIIKTATLVAETQDFTTAIGEIEASVKTLGGYIESCNVQNMNYSYSASSSVHSVRNAKYVLRIPADKLDTFLSEAGELLNVTSSSSNAEDISGEYYDIEARISVLETERALVEKMLSEAKSIDTMIDLEKRLYDIIYEIESYKTAIKVYDGKVAYSTVTLDIREVADLTDLNADDSFGARFKNAVKKSWDNTVDFCEELVIFLVYAAPAIVVVGSTAIAIAAVALVVVLIVRRSVKHARASKGN